MLDLGKVGEFLRSPTRVFVGIALVTGVLLFAPSKFIATLGVLDLRDQYRAWIGIAFLISTAFVCVGVGTPVWKALLEQVQFRRAMHHRKRRLKQLTPREKEILRRYVYQDTRTQAFEISDGVVRELEALGILHRASEVSHRFTSFPYNIQPWAWDYLKKNPELLE